MADTKGLKKITIISCSLLSISTLLFGFSSSFYWAIVTRFLQGCSIGLLVTCKAYISAVCDNTNIAFGMVLTTTAFYAGMIIGPAIGGERSFDNKIKFSTFDRLGSYPFTSLIWTSSVWILPVSIAMTIFYK